MDILLAIAFHLILAQVHLIAKIISEVLVKGFPCPWYPWVAELCLSVCVTAGDNPSAVFVFFLLLGIIGHLFLPIDTGMVTTLYYSVSCVWCVRALLCYCLEVTQNKM